VSIRVRDAFFWCFTFLLASALSFALAVPGAHGKNLDGRYDNAPNREWYESQKLSCAANAVPGEHLRPSRFLAKCLKKFGSGGGTRTPDPRIMIPSSAYSVTIHISQ
jgi:hypothetical protein